MKQLVIISAILTLQLSAPVMAQESLGQSQWITPGASSESTIETTQSDLINSGLSGESSSSNAFEQSTQMGQSQWMQPGQNSSAPMSMGQSEWTQPGQTESLNQLGQSELMQPGQNNVASGQLGQSGWMQPQQGSAPSGQMGQSGWMQPKQDNSTSEFQGMVRKDARGNDTAGGGGKWSALAESIGTAMQVPMAMAGAARMMGFGYGGYGFAPMYSPFGFAPGFGSYAMPMSRGTAFTGAASYMAGRAVNRMLRGR
jgi:hypothetical protein